MPLPTQVQPQVDPTAAINSSPVQSLLGTVAPSQPLQQSGLGAMPATPAAPPAATYLSLPAGLQGMPVTPPPQLGTNQAAAQQNQQPPQQQAPPPEQNPQQPMNQTMMLAAVKKAAEDRRAAQIAQYNAQR